MQKSSRFPKSPQEIQLMAKGIGIPPYLREARSIILSKSEDHFPAIGDVRIIAILPAITKLFEQCLLILIKIDLLKNPLHQNQRGFCDGKSNTYNSLSLFTVKTPDKDSNAI